MTNILQKFKTQYIVPNSFGSHVFALLTGIAIAQVIPILFSPVITRLYTPKEFGVYSEFLAVVTILATISTLRYDYAITIAKSMSEAKRLSTISLISLIVFLIIISVVLSSELGSTIFIRKYRELSNRYFLDSVGIGIVIVVLHNICYNYNLYLGNIYRISQIKVINGIINVTVSICLSYFTRFGMVIGYLSGYFIAVIALYNRSWFKDEKRLNVKELVTTAKYYHQFPAYMTIHSLLNSAAVNLPVLFLGYYYSSQESGYYSLAMRLFIPFDIICLSVSQILLPRLSRPSGREALYPFCLKLLLKLFYITVIPVVAIALFSRQIFPLVFGDDYTVSGVYFQILMPMLYVRFFGSIFSNILIIAREQKYGLLIEIVNFGAVIYIFRLAKRSCYDTLMLYSLCLGTVSVFKLLFYFYIAKKAGAAKA